MKFLNLLIVCVVFSISGHAKDMDNEEEMYYAKKYFLIASSTKEYKKAKKIAEYLSLKSGITLDLRGLHSDSSNSLTFSQKMCEKEWEEYPCYLARGRYDDGVYISIEDSNAYDFKDGYYIVIVASGKKEEVQKVLNKIKPFIKDAYIKTSKVYMGCMH